MACSKIIFNDLKRFLNRNNINYSLMLLNRSQSTLSKSDLLKKTIKDYGTTVIVFHVGISLISLGFFYSIVSSGIDLHGCLMQYKWFNSNEVLKNKIATSTGTFVIAYAIHKVFAPDI